MKLGAIHIEKPLILAPMHEVADYPFRMICKELGADILVTEFVSAEAVIRGIPVVLEKMRITPAERPVGIQIFGSNEESMARAADIIEGLKPDFIDVNCGCWSKRHAARGEGAGMLRDLPLMERVLNRLVKTVKLPVTVKTRLGWDKENIVIPKVAEMVEQAGCKALSVHCRTKSQGYKGTADWSWLEKIRKVIKIPLIGNGDVVSSDDARALFDMGCDGVMIGRGAMANPWIFRQIKSVLFDSSSVQPVGIQEKIELCLRHLDLNIEYKGEFAGVASLRKFYAGYFKGFPEAHKLRIYLMGLKNPADIRKTLEQYLETHGNSERSS